MPLQVADTQSEWVLFHFVLIVIYCYVVEDWGEKAFTFLTKPFVPTSSNWRYIFMKSNFRLLLKSQTFLTE